VQLPAVGLLAVVQPAEVMVPAESQPQETDEVTVRLLAVKPLVVVLPEVAPAKS